MKQRIAAVALVFLGCMQMLGDVAGWHSLRAIGLASHASPAPKVFTAQEGFETFSSRFYIDWLDLSGASHSLELTPASYARIEGPYNRRNAYGAALSYGPVLAANSHTRPMLQAVMRHAFCGDAPLLRELAIPPARMNGSLQVRLEPRESTNRNAGWQTTFVIDCGEAI